MYAYCVYPAMLKSPKQPSNCLKREETSVVIIWFCQSVLILLPFLTVSQHESGTRKAISWSVTEYSKTLSSQCNLTAHMEPVQTKM